MFMFVNLAKVSSLVFSGYAVLYGRLRLMSPVLGRTQVISCVALLFVRDENFRLQKKRV